MSYFRKRLEEEEIKARRAFSPFYTATTYHEKIKLLSEYVTYSQRTRLEEVIKHRISTPFYLEQACRIGSRLLGVTVKELYVVPMHHSPKRVFGQAYTQFNVVVLYVFIRGNIPIKGWESMILKSLSHELLHLHPYNFTEEQVERYTPYLEGAILEEFKETNIKLGA